MSKKSTRKLIDPVTSLGDLRRKAQTDDRYRLLAIAAAENLGGNIVLSFPDSKQFAQAMQWLSMNADETDSEDGVVAEVNACRDVV